MSGVRARPGRRWQCPDCGYVVNGGAPEYHECDPRSVVRVQTGRFDAQWRAFLESPAGRFAVFYAQRMLRG